MKKFKGVMLLFWTMFKIGLFTFGGGYVMVTMIDREIVMRKKWLDSDEFLDVLSIAESTPGPLAVNTATYVGYKIEGVLGSVFATIGVVLPSFIVILIISYFFEAFLALKYVQYAFLGINACVAYLILSAGVKMLKKMEKKWFNVLLSLVTIVGLICVSIFNLPFSSIYFILLGAFLGLFVYLVPYCINRIKTNKTHKNNSSSESDDIKKEDKNV